MLSAVVSLQSARCRLPQFGSCAGLNNSAGLKLAISVHCNKLVMHPAAWWMGERSEAKRIELFPVFYFGVENMSGLCSVP